MKYAAVAIRRLQGGRYQQHHSAHLTLVSGNLQQHCLMVAKQYVAASPTTWYRKLEAHRPCSNSFGARNK